MDFGMIDYKYKTYLESVSRNQTDIIRYATECIYLESGDISGIVVLNESMMDSITKAIQGIIAAIKGMWKKFAERMNEVLNTDLAFLEKYKHLMKKPPLSREITMYKYNIDAITNLTVPVFKYDRTMKTWLDSDDASNSFITTFMPNSGIKVESNENEDITDAVKDHLRGGQDEEEIDGKTLDIQRMFKFIVDYKKIIDAIMKNRGSMDKSEADLSRLLATMKPKEDKKEENKEDKPSDTTSNKIEVPTESAYSRVYGKYVNEVKIGKAKSPDSDSGTSSVSSIDKKTTDDITANTGGETKTSDELEMINKNASTFFRCCGAVIAGQLTIAQEVQKNYMAILRQHVRDHVKDAE